MTSTSTWTVNTEEDPETGEVILPFPEEMLAQVGWKEGDELEFIDNNDGSWSIKKVNDTNSVKVFRKKTT